MAVHSFCAVTHACRSSRRAYQRTPGAAVAPCRTTLIITVTIAMLKISSACGTGSSSSNRMANRIDATPRGPNQPRNNLVDIDAGTPTRLSPTGSIRITVRLSAA